MTAVANNSGLPILLLLTHQDELSPWVEAKERKSVLAAKATLREMGPPFSSSSLHGDAVSEATAGSAFGCIIAACWLLSL